MGKKKGNQTSITAAVTPDLRFVFTAKNNEQKNMLKVINNNYITFVIGCAGTGKTHVSIAYSLQQLFRNEYNRIILTRPIVASENLGWLPGVVENKVKDYFVPSFTIMSQMIDRESLKILTNGNGIDAKIQILPLAFMRGHSFNHTIVVADEFQNSSIEQMRLLLTRIGENCKIIVCGDVTQSDIREKNGLVDAVAKFKEVAKQNKGIGLVELTEKSIVRHPIIELIEEVYKKK